jgi:glycosyltransferase involved in cell wall biosynthesis
MRIGIDAHAIGGQLTGNETYIKNLILALAEIDQANDYVLFFTRPELARQWTGRFPNFQVHRLRPHTPYIRIPFSLPLALYRTGVDLLHVQYTAPPWCPKPVVATIHDLSYEHFPELFTARERFFFKRTILHTARQAAAVLTGSEYSRQDIAQTYHVPPEKVIVTPYGFNQAFQPVRDSIKIEAIKKKYQIEQAYLLTVGNLQPRKNLPRLIRAYTRLREQVDDFHHQLVIVGKKAWLFEPVLREARHSRYVTDIIFTDYVPEEDLPILYSGATVFVYPSLFEGFGLPVLEAMACGAPVITSNTSSLPEVVGDAGIMIDPHDEQALAVAIQRIVADARRRAHLSEQGLQQAQKFSWRRTAELTLRTYEAIVTGGALQSP